MTLLSSVAIALGVPMVDRPPAAPADSESRPVTLLCQVTYLRRPGKCRAKTLRRAILQYAESTQSKVRPAQCGIVPAATGSMWHRAGWGQSRSGKYEQHGIPGA